MADNNSDKRRRSSTSRSRGRQTQPSTGRRKAPPNPPTPTTTVPIQSVLPPILAPLVPTTTVAPGPVQGPVAPSTTTTTAAPRPIQGPVAPSTTTTEPDTTTTSPSSTTTAPAKTTTTTSPAKKTSSRGGGSRGGTAAEIKAYQDSMNKPSPAPTTTGTGTGAGGAVAGAKGRTALPSNWEAKFREMFPAQAWLLDIDPAKYADLHKVLQDAVRNQAWQDTTSQQRFSQQLDGTSFFKELASTNVIRDIKAAVGDLGFDSIPFNSFVTKAMNMGWKGDNLKFEAYKETFRTDSNTGQYVNPTAVERVKKSAPYLSVAKIGTDYFSQVSDTTIQATLTGAMTTEDVSRQQRELAKTKYGHLANLIDQGFTMADLSSGFRDKAAALLEIDPNSINMADAKWETALNYGEEGKKRMMTQGEWQKLLRTDKQYNWDQTQNAKQEARQLANTISQAFGKVL